MNTYSNTFACPRNDGKAPPQTVGLSCYMPLCQQEVFDIIARWRRSPRRQEAFCHLQELQILVGILVFESMS